MKVITDGKNNYVTLDGCNTVTLTADRDRALVLKETAAKNLIKNSLKNRKIYSGVVWKLEEVSQPEAEQNNRIYENKSESELLQMISDSLEAYNELGFREQAMLQQLHEQTKLREDLEHAIENMQFNASEGYKLCKKIQNISRQRRILKKNVAKADVIRKELFPEPKRVESALKKIKSIDSSDSYHFRMTSDFGESIRLGQTSKEMGITL